MKNTIVVQHKNVFTFEDGTVEETYSENFDNSNDHTITHLHTEDAGVFINTASFYCPYIPKDL